MAASDREAPAEVRLGSVLVSLLDPHPGEEVAFNRWYERDHFYSGCMVGPHFFAGRRFVATRRLKDERLPEQGSMLPDVRDGSYLALYWLLAGHHEEAVRWAVDRVQALIAHDRMFSGRRPVHAGFYLSRFAVSRDPDGVPPELALDHPHAGVSLSLWEAPSVEAAEALRRSLAERDLAASMSGPGPSLCLVLEPEPLPPDSPAASEGPESLARRVLVIGFYPEDPAASVRCWTREVSDRVERAVGGRLLFSAPFIPTIPGTDRYADELW